jgi:hypothetical protein
MSESVTQRPPAEVTGVRPQAGPPHALPEDVLKEMADRARTYFKLDLTYVAAMLAIATTLKLERPSLFEAIGNAARYGMALCVLILADTFIATRLFDAWVDARRGASELVWPRYMRALSWVQPFAHGIFVVFVLLTVFSRSEGWVTGLDVYRTEAELQQAIEEFAIHEKRYPASLHELEQHDLSTPAMLARLSSEQLSYETAGDHDYKLTFRKGRWHPSDQVATHQLQLRSVVETLEKTPPFP